MATTTTPLSREQRRTKIENVLTKFIYYVLPVIVGITLYMAMTSAQNTAIRTQGRRAENGLNLLIIVLFIKPIALLGRKYARARIITIRQWIDMLKYTIASNKRNPRRIEILKDLWGLAIDTIFSLSTYLMRFRRQLGVACFWMILAHAGLLQIFRVRQDLPLFFNIGESTIITGMIGLFGLLIAAITSNGFSIKVLNPNWKMIQMITVYIAFFFAAIHSGNTFALILFAILKYMENKEIPNPLFHLVKNHSQKIYEKHVQKR